MECDATYLHRYLHCAQRQRRARDVERARIPEVGARAKKNRPSHLSLAGGGEATLARAARVVSSAVAAGQNDATHHLDDERKDGVRQPSCDNTSWRRDERKDGVRQPSCGIS